MARTKDWKDLIPTSGEARALLELKGKAGGGKAMFRRRKSGINRQRTGAAAKLRKPRIMIPLGPAPTNVETGGEDAQLGQVQHLAGSLGTGIFARWVFALTPERLTMDDIHVSPLFGATNEGDTVSADIDPGDSVDDVIRIIGMRGSLFFTPQVPLGEAASLTSANFGGKWGYAWTVQEAVGATLSDGTPTYNFSNYDISTSTGGLNDRGLLPVQGVGPYLGRLQNVDWRFGQAKNSIIKYGMGRWNIPANVCCGSDDGGVLTYERVVANGTRSLRIPLLRKCCVDVGKGRALALVLWYRDDDPSGETGGAPAGRLDYHDMRIIGYKRD